MHFNSNSLYVSMLLPHIYFLKYITNPKETKRIKKNNPIKINGLNIKKTLL